MTFTTISPACNRKDDFGSPGAAKFAATLWQPVRTSWSQSPGCTLRAGQTDRLAVQLDQRLGRPPGVMNDVDGRFACDVWAVGWHPTARTQTQGSSTGTGRTECNERRLRDRGLGRRLLVRKIVQGQPVHFNAGRRELDPRAKTRSPRQSSATSKERAPFGVRRLVGRVLADPGRPSP